MARVEPITYLRLTTAQLANIIELEVKTGSAEEVCPVQPNIGRGPATLIMTLVWLILSESVNIARRLRSPKPFVSCFTVYEFRFKGVNFCTDVQKREMKWFFGEHGW